MFSLVGRLFGSAEASKQVLTGITDGVDKLFYTDEEKSEDAAKARTEGLAVYMEWLKSTTGSRVARRLLALGAFTMWAGENLASVIFRLAAIWAPTPLESERMTEASKFLIEQANGNSTIVGLVFAFYFGGPVLVDATAPALSRWMDKGKS